MSKAGYFDYDPIEFYAGYKGNNRLAKTIKRPEEYRKCLMAIQTDN